MELRFPLFVDLRDRPVVVVGGGTVGLRRAEVLRDFGARVTVIAPALARDLAGVTHLCRAYRAGDLTGAFLAVAATNDASVNDAVEAEARQLGVLFNRSDRPEACDFYFPAICRTDTLVAGLVGDGRDHKKTARAAKAVRETLEELE